MNKYYYDTSALIEISKGNPNYEKYRSRVYMILSKLNLLEYVYYLLRINKEEKVNEAFGQLGYYIVDYDDEILIKAAKMKFKHKKEKLSFVDCIGYLLAKDYKVKFLTGDEKFKNKENVEFVR